LSSRNENSSVRVRIFGDDHVVKGDASDQYVHRLAGILDEHMKGVQRNNPSLTRYRVAVLVALNLADQLEKLKEEHKELLQLMEEAN